MSDRIYFADTLLHCSNIDEVKERFVDQDIRIGNLDKYSDKVILPSSVLEDLVSQQARLSLTSLPQPLIFKLSVSKTKFCYVGVKEFSAPSNYVLLPFFVQKKLDLVKDNNESVVEVELVNNIPKGKALTLKPLDIDYKVTDWKFFLEAKLNNLYVCLTKGDIIYIYDDVSDQICKLLVEDVKPASTVCIIDTDIDLSVVPLDDSHAEAILKEREFDKNEAKIINMKLEDSVSINQLEAEMDKPIYQIENIQNLKKTTKTIYVQFVLSDPEFDLNLIDLFISNDKFIDKQTWIWSTFKYSDTIRTEGVLQLEILLDSPFINDELSFLPYIWQGKTFGELRILSEGNHGILNKNNDDNSGLGADQGLTAEDKLNYTVCSNCGSKISKQSQMLHENFCFRNNVKCDKGCNKIFRKTIPTEHWHCDICFSEHKQIVFGDSSYLYQHHNNIYHQEYDCKCGGHFTNLSNLAFHKATECKFKLHECKFCHLIVPRGEPTAESFISNLSSHESSCGSKTENCPKCDRPIRRRDLENHLKLHDLNRLDQATPQKCLNENCIRTKKLNEFGLCETCFGPSYSSVYDPDNSRLKSRFERRYVIQLTRGCGNTWCKNKECKSSGLIPPEKYKTTGDLINHVKNDLLTKIPKIPGTEITNLNDGVYEFCVDFSIVKKKFIADWLYEEGEYSLNWCCEAVNQCNDEQNARAWLQENAITLDEEVKNSIF